MILAAVLFVSGCATTAAKPQPITQLQTQVTDLQQRMEDQEKEIVDLKYEVKELGGKAETKEVVPLEEGAVEAPKKASAPKAIEGSHADLIKVDVSGIELQKALKGAGVYDGKIDGKVGPRTKNAVVEFQRQHNLKADGVVGQKTWNELKQYLTE
jgi:peptidoglycan hydrolase-like protein with peptidoglycan-binding domain